MPMTFQGLTTAATVRGTTKFPNEVREFDYQFLGVENTSAKLKFISDTIIIREHNDEITEISFSILASELVSEDGHTLPYGANPRFPVLCNTFDNIFKTVFEEQDKFILRNTGLDIFCSTAAVNPDGTVELQFSNGRHGIANGGLTTSVISYCVQEGMDLDGVKISVRIWAGENFDMNELVSAADARNAHRELRLADRLNQLGAFDHIRNSMAQDWRERWEFTTGDIDAEADSENIGDLCHMLYGFTLSPGEGHPVRNPNVAGGVHNSIKKKGRLTSPKTGIDSMKQTVGI
jgi:hypothetical protein